ncbi:HlyD family efflux transporter periplasmic adaptor subunit [Trinickia sp. YCB016]
MEVTHLPQFRDVPWRWIAYAASVVVIAAIVFAFLGQVELKQDVPCEIVSSSEVKIQGLTGIVAAIYVRPTQQVEPGTPLFRLDRDLSLSSDGRQRQQFDEQMRNDQIRAADAQFRQRSADIDAQLTAVNLTERAKEGEMRSVAAQITQDRQLAAETEHKLSRLKSMSEYVTADRIEQASADVHERKVAVEEGAARQQQLLGDIETLRGTQAELAAKLKEEAAEHSRDVQDIFLKYEQLRENVTISAPKAGVVTFSSLVPGRTLDAGDVALVIGTEPRRPLIAALRIPSRQRGFVRAGQIVRLKFDAFPYARFGTYEAHIDSISGTTVGASAAARASPGASGSEGEYMAWATLRGDTFQFGKERFPILSGMRATASIVVERRTIAEWVLAPLFRMFRG